MIQKKRGRPAGLSEDTRNTILDAGREVFKQFGLKRTSIDEICKKAEVSRMTFYRYYDDKIEIALAILYAEYRQIETQVAQVFSSSSSFQKKFEVLRGMNLNLHKKLGEMFINEAFAVNTEPRLKEFYKDIKTLRKNQIDQFLLQGQKEGCINPKLSLSFLHAMIQVIDELYFKNEIIELFPDVEQRAETLSEFLFFGFKGASTNRMNSPESVTS